MAVHPARLTGSDSHPVSSEYFRVVSGAEVSDIENEDRAASEVFLVALCGAALVEVQLVWCGA